MKEYHLHRDQPSPLHFELNNMSEYLEGHSKHCYLPHRHSFYQLIWFTSAGQHHVDYETLSHEANTIFFINKNQVHHFCDYSPNEGYLFHFNDEFLHQQDSNGDNWLRYKLFNEIGTPWIAPPKEELTAIEQLTHCLLLEYESKTYNYEQQIYHLFRIILLKAERLKHLQHPDLAETDMNLKTVIQFKSLLDAHLHQNLSIDEYAEQLHISAKSLTAFTKKYLHQTPGELVQSRKVLEAKRLLSNKQLSIQEVAYRLGFEQPTYFTKYFKKNTGYTPKAFVQSMVSH